MSQGNNQQRNQQRNQSRREQSEEIKTKGLPTAMLGYLYFTLIICTIIIFMYSTGAAVFEKDEWDSAFQYLGTVFPVMGIIFLGIVQNMREET